MKEDFIHFALDKKKSESAFRSLSIANHLIDFTSNDYLGLAHHPKIKAALSLELKNDTEKRIGSTGSRLLTGNNEYVENLEHKIANFHIAEKALIFNSGYDANIGIVSCIAKKEDTIICDELCHASIIDGMRLSLAGKKYKFKHNDFNDLEKKIRNSKGRVFVILEAVYSMDGDLLPIDEIVQLKEKYNLHLILDEAHSNGMYGVSGKGFATQNDLQKHFLARIYTFGKAFGSHGAAIVGSEALINYLINFARSFIYTTALPFHCLASINVSYDYIQTADLERETLFKRITFFKSKLESFGLDQISNLSPIQSYIKPGNQAVRQLALSLQKNQFNARAILSPTVTKGKERVRICIHSFNSETEIFNLLQTISDFESCKS